MFVGYYQDNKNNVLKVSERINGQRITEDFPLILEYYVQDPYGVYEGYDSKRLKKISLKNTYQLKQHKEECLANNVKTYELNFNLPNKVLYQQFKQGESPDLHISFLDIEVDRKGFEDLTVKELVEKACCPINAISIYNNWQESMFTLMLRPENLTHNEAESICKEFDNTLLFEDEKQLLEGIIALLDDADVVVGWNSCIRTDSSIWLNDRIIEIKDVKEGQELYDSILKKKSNISVKDEYKLSTVLNNTIYASNEHRFPVSVFEPNIFVSENKFEENMKDMTVEDIIKEQYNGKVIFLKLKKGNNTNPNMTYRDYIINNFDWIVKNYNICFSKMPIKIDYSKSRVKQKCYDRIKDYISKEKMIEYIKSENVLKLFSYNKFGSQILDLNEKIDNDLLHLSGLIYTDGTLYKNGICVYNKNKNLIDNVTKIFDEYYKVNKPKQNPYKISNGVYRRRISLNNKIGLLRGLYYTDTKCINKTLLSQMSYEQFMAFWSGCIDGDGWVSDKIGFCNYINDIDKFQELLLWNGIASTRNNANNNLYIKACNNIKLKDDMKLWVDYKQDRLSLFNKANNNNSKSRAIETKYKEYNDIYVRLNPIEKTGNTVEMIDICTTSEYFYSAGIKTHNCFFDTPYIVRRIENVLGKGQSKRLCLWNIEPKLKDKTNAFGDKNISYEIYGKWFTDYLELYKKHERGKKESYKLDSIAEIELGENKVQHDESLDDMYRQRYKDFILYNRQDTMLIKKFEDKLKYISIHNAQAHDIRCSLESTMGTVAWVDQAIINEAHDKGLIVNDKVEGKNDAYEGIIPPGAYVPTPRTGLCNYIMSFDMNSLYPTSARSLNMSPEVIVAQIRLDLTKEFLWNKIKTNNLYKNISKQIPDWGAAWGNVWGTLEYQEVMKQSDTKLTLDLENGESGQATAKEIYDMVFSEGSNLCISAFGTIFRTDKMSLINSIFTRWYAQRKEYKKEMAKYEDMAVGVKIEDEDILKQLSE